MNQEEKTSFTKEEVNEIIKKEKRKFGTLKCAAFSIILLAISYLLYAKPFFLDFLPMAVVFANKVIIPESVIIGIFLVGLAGIISVSGVIVSIIKLKVLPLLLNIVALAVICGVTLTVSKSFHEAYPEKNVEFSKIDKKQMCKMFKVQPRNSVK